MSNLTKMLTLAAVLVVVLSVILFLTQKPPTQVAEFDVDQTLAELDEAETQLDSLDAELEMLDADASGL